MHMTKPAKPLVGTRNADGSVRVELPDTPVQTHERTSLETSPAVAATAARLMHSDDADVRSVAASALSQALDDAKYMRITTTVSSDRPSTLGSVTAFNVDDFRAQLPALLANGGTVGFNLATRDEVEQAVTVARELGYETRVDVSGLRVEVRRVP